MTRIVRRWLGGYEERIRFFLALLVFMLAAANTANFLLLRSAWLTLRDAVEESVDAHGRMASAALVERWQPGPGRRPDRRWSPLCAWRGSRNRRAASPCR